ncbi:hypothetical protein [Methylobacterium trifolii]|uniref:Uncharacterized protein n=1 Tax=Methylobacterium trifolii TaxID=1003092 RepID=A0ABQ4U107_9HYPH|nr:hypothetical protein [Methylobacterium trifolii]GJE60827.1 hypothetical protein MPOCJGCO_2945 [Methylobacterium trifolii]
MTRRIDPDRPIWPSLPDSGEHPAGRAGEQDGSREAVPASSSGSEAIRGTEVAPAEGFASFEG